MKGIPLPPDTALWVQILFWALLILIGLLFAGLMYFVKKYIDKNDAHHTAVEGTLKEHGKKFSETNDNMMKLGNRMEAEANKIDKAATEMRKVQADFQIQINRELLEIHKGTAQIKTDLTESKGQVALLSKDLKSLVDTVDKHQHSLSLGAQALAKQRENLMKMQTEIVEIGKEVVLIRDKKPKS